MERVQISNKYDMGPFITTSNKVTEQKTWAQISNEKRWKCDSLCSFGCPIKFATISLDSQRASKPEREMLLSKDWNSFNFYWNCAFDSVEMCNDSNVHKRFENADFGCIRSWAFIRCWNCIEIELKLYIRCESPLFTFCIKYFFLFCCAFTRSLTHSCVCFVCLSVYFKVHKNDANKIVFCLWKYRCEARSATIESRRCAALRCIALHCIQPMQTTK